MKTYLKIYIYKKEIKNGNTENVNWKLTIVNKSLTLNSTLP